MYIVTVAPECAPIAKVGGLADVVYGLNKELQLRGHTVEIFLPKYDCMRYDQIEDLHVAYENLAVPWYAGAINCTVWYGRLHGLDCFFLDPHSADNFFNRRSFYGFNDDSIRFAFFSKAALEFMLKSNKRPEIIHCHDWQTGLVPVLLFELYKYCGLERQRVCFTIHNFKYQGTAAAHVLTALGLHHPEYYYHLDRLGETYNRSVLNFMKGGIVYSNFVTTVSPHYAWEAHNGDQGYGLGPTLNTHQGKYGGILNGIDYGMWNPEIDPLIASHYTWKTLENKTSNKNALRNRLLLRDGHKPIIASVGRLDPQKGVHLIRHALFYALDRGAQFVLLGSSPVAQINDEFWGLKHRFNNNPDCHLEIGYDEELAHLIYAGADMMIVPSLFEPCGLTQMISLRYGTVPVVRWTGGLADTVFDRDYAPKPIHERNGYTFNDPTPAAFEVALDRAMGLWQYYPGEFYKLMVNGMRYDFSWHQSGTHYLNIYEYIRDK